MEKISQFIARLFLGQIFLLSGVFKISGYEGTQGYMETMGVPGMLLPLVIFVEIAGGLAIIAGWQIRLTALALAAFTLIAAVIFHHNLADQMQIIMFTKNIAITGGLILLATMAQKLLSDEGCSVHATQDPLDLLPGSCRLKLEQLRYFLSVLHKNRRQFCNQPGDNGLKYTEKVIELQGAHDHDQQSAGYDSVFQAAGKICGCRCARMGFIGESQENS